MFQTGRLLRTRRGCFLQVWTAFKNWIAEYEKSTWYEGFLGELKRDEYIQNKYDRNWGNMVVVGTKFQLRVD